MHFGSVRLKSERGRRNRAIGELRAADVTVEELEITLEFCRKRFTDYSEIAVCHWLSRALQEQEQSGARRDTFMRLLKKD